MSRWPATATDPLLGGLPGSSEPGTLQPPPHLSCSPGCPLQTQASRERKAAPLQRADDDGTLRAYMENLGDRKCSLTKHFLSGYGRPFA